MVRPRRIPPPPRTRAELEAIAKANFEAEPPEERARVEDLAASRRARAFTDFLVNGTPAAETGTWTEETGWVADETEADRAEKARLAEAEKHYNTIGAPRPLKW